jgi:hypothetical protein
MLVFLLFLLRFADRDRRQCSENAPQTCIDKTEGDLVPEAETKWLNIEKNSVTN